MEILTKEDLHEFGKSLLEDIQTIVKGKNEKSKKWLKSTEVRKLLNISPGTLQNLRINGTLTYTKVGGIIYYSDLDIEKLLEINKVNALPRLFK
ncbi:helix-turn-helix domain-containing protein [Flavobacterium gillisiae]|uniref:helix-turn-helix domain-containing protein n=1 Tax=Flavobacterium gillisiae TaxID=150146 RepID=UPI000B885F14|nr:helix-turn-helix domain-containing protein [Flavobacterium gillisiae]